MYFVIFCAALSLCSPAKINAEDNNENDSWGDLPNTVRKSEGVLDELMDPLGLKYYRKDPFTDDAMVSVTEEEKHKALWTEPDSTGQCSDYEIEHRFLQRFVNMLINKCTNNNEANVEMLKKISVKVEITSADLKALHNMRDIDDSASVIRVLNSIISTMTIDSNLEEHSSYLSLFSELITSTDVWLDAAVILFAIIPIFIFALGGKVMRIVVITLLLTFSVSYYATYKEMLLKSKINNERILLKPLKCSSDELAWYQTLFPFTSESECQKRWNALNVDPAVEITPVKIISHMIAVATFQPLEQFGIMFSQFSSAIFESQSFLYGMIVFTTAVLIIIIGLIACCYGIFGRGINVSSDRPPYSRQNIIDPVQTTSGQQMFPEGVNELTSSLPIHAHPHQPIYIFTNYPKNIANNGRIKTTEQ